MRILVTGGAGFIGSHVADAYIRDGHEVAVLDDLSRGSRENVNPKAGFYQGDIRDRDLVRKVFSEFQPQVINHHAAQMDVRRAVRDPVFDAEVNILGSLNLLEESVAHKTSHFVHISSAGTVYGEPTQLPVSENHPINPETPYGITKHTLEHYLYTYSHLYGMSYVVLRYANVYGPRQSSMGEAGVFAIFSEQILNGIRPVIYGDGSKTRDYVYIDDVAAANVLALTKGHGQIFNIATQIATTDFEVFSLVAKALDQGDLTPGYADVRPGEILHICLDINKAKRLLGWSPAVPVAEGARRTVAFFQEVAGGRHGATA